MAVMGDRLYCTSLQGTQSRKVRHWVGRSLPILCPACRRGANGEGYARGLLNSEGKAVSASREQLGKKETVREPAGYSFRIYRPSVDR